MIIRHMFFAFYLSEIMTYSIKDLNKTMLIRYIDQLRYENRLLKEWLSKVNNGNGGNGSSDDSINTPPRFPYEPEIQLAASDTNIVNELFNETDSRWLWNGGVTCIVYVPQLDKFLVTGNGDTSPNGTAASQSGYIDLVNNTIVIDDEDHGLQHGGFYASAYGDGDIMLVGYRDKVSGAYSNYPGMSAYLKINKDNTWNWNIVNYVDGGLPLNKHWYAVAYGNGMFVAVASGVSEEYSGTGNFSDGNNNKYTIAYSKDHKTWRFVNTPVGSYYSGIAYGNGKFLACCCEGSSVVFAVSSDGIEWNFNPSGVTQTPSNVTYNCIAYNEELNVFAASTVNDSGAQQINVITIDDNDAISIVSSVTAGSRPLPYIWSTGVLNPSFIVTNMTVVGDELNYSELYLITSNGSNNFSIINADASLDSTGKGANTLAIGNGKCVYGAGNSISTIAAPSS